MRKKGLFLVQNDCMYPDNKTAVETVRTLDGQKALVWVHNARYPEHHGLVFAVLQKIGEAIGVEVEDVLLSLKYDTGRFDFIKLINGEVVTRAHSIAFESMPQAEFQKFWNEALVVFTDKWKLADDVMADIREMVRFP